MYCSLVRLAVVPDTTINTIIVFLTASLLSSLFLSFLTSTPSFFPSHNNNKNKNKQQQKQKQKTPTYLTIPTHPSWYPSSPSLPSPSLQCPPRQVKRLLDKNLTFHKAIAWMIVVSSAMHVIAHWYNYERLIGLVSQDNLNNKWPWEPRQVPSMVFLNISFVSL